MRVGHIALVCGFAASGALGCGTAEAPTEAERQAQRMNRTSVHVHVTLRGELDSERGAAVAGQLARAASNRATADQLGQRLFEARGSGAERLASGDAGFSPLAPLRVASSEVSAAEDSAGFFLALVDAAALDERRVPKQVLVYEASRLSLDRVEDPELRRMARATAAFVFARAGYCARVDALAEQGMDESTGVTRQATLAAEVVLGGAAACCAMRRHRLEVAADRIEGWLDAGQELGMHAASVALLRVWVALARADVAEAREHLEAARAARVPEEDRAHYETLRNAVARTERDGRFQPSAGAVDRRWLSAFVLSHVHRVSPERGLMGPQVAERPEAAAWVELAKGEAEVIAAARRRYPMFDLAQEGDRSAFQRLADLFR